MNMSLSVAALFSLAGGLALASEPSEQLFVNWQHVNTGGRMITDAQGTAAVPTASSLLVVTDAYTGNCSFGGDLACWGLAFDMPNRSNWWMDAAGLLSLGEGGLEARKSATFQVGYSSAHTRIKLMADQVWEAKSGATMSVCLGTCSAWNANFYDKERMTAASGVTSLTLKGDLAFWYSWDSSLPDVDVRVEYPAKLLPIKRYSLATADSNPALGAKSVTLSGEGTSLSLGESYPAPVNNSYKGQTTTVMSPAVLGEALTLENGADIALAADAVLSIPTLSVVGGASAFTGVGNLALDQDLTTINLASDASLTLPVLSPTAGHPNAALAVRGDGSVSMSFAGGIKSMELDEDVSLAVSGHGRCDMKILGAKGLEVVVDDGTFVYLPATSIEGFAGTKIVVSGGLLVLDTVPSGITVETKDGGSYKTGLDDGVVTDAVRTEDVLSIGVGETWDVYGNGLTDATALTLDGGMLKFRVSGACVSSPVNVSKSSVVWTEHSVTGEISGKVTCAIQDETQGFVANGDGCLVLSGGFESELPEGDWWDLPKRNSFYAWGGCVVLRTGSYYFGNGKLLVGCETLKADVKDSPRYCSHFLVGTGAVVTFADRGGGWGNSYEVVHVRPPVDSSNYRASATLEIGEGGSLTIPWNRHLWVGNEQDTARVLLTGGELTVNRYGSFVLGNGIYTTGELEMWAGTLNLNVPILRNANTAVSRLLWHGGTIKIGANYQDFGNLIESYTKKPATSEGDKLKACCQILGDACVLDLGAYAKTALTNCPPVYERSEWVGTGRLTVKGGTTCKTLVMNSFPSGVKLGLENGASVVLPASARVYDPVKSSYDWVRVYPEINFTPTTGWLVDPGTLALSEFLPGDEGVSLAPEAQALALSVGAMHIPADGWWNNSVPFFGAGIACSFTDLTFDSGAEWNVTRCGNGVAAIVIPGKLTFPDAPGSVTFSKTRSDQTCGGNVLATAEGGISGGPAIVVRKPFGADVVIDAEAGVVNVNPYGALLIVR